MAIPSIIDDGGEEWEGGPLESESRDDAAPEHLPEESGEALQSQLDKLDAEQDFEFSQEPEIADEGVPPPGTENLDQQLQTLEENEPFEQPEAGASEVEAPSVEQPDPGLLETPEDTPDPEGSETAPPATLKEFMEKSGGELPGGFPGPSKDGPIDPLKQYLDSGFSMSQQHTDFLLDHASQLDELHEALERGRL